MARISFGKKLIVAVLIACINVTLFFVSIEAGLRVIGVIVSRLQEHKNRELLKGKDTYRIMCVGESTTLSGGSDSYPAQMERILNQDASGIKFSVINKGAVGIDTSYIVKHMEENLQKYRPDMVVTMMGVSDEYVRYYDDIPESRSALFTNFKSYRFFRILIRNIMNQIEKKDIYAVRERVCAPPSFKQSAASGKTAQLGLKEDERCIVLGKAFEDEGRYLQAEALYQKAIALNPRNDNAYVALSDIYREKGMYSQAQARLEKALALNPGNDDAYFHLGCLYQDQGLYAPAEEFFKKAISLNPRNDKVYAQLGWLYRFGGRNNEVENMLLEAIKYDPESSRLYTSLGWEYMDQGRSVEAQAAYKKALLIEPDNEEACIQLGWLYFEQEKYPEAEVLFKKAVQLDPRNDELIGQLATIYEEMGRHADADRYHKKANDTRLRYYSDLTRDNYLKLKVILDSKGIRLVCVQYPVRSVKSLKMIFGEDAGVIFVDNEKLFKDALRKGSYREYFIDMCCGEFGHCTAKGNRLLAENAARAIIGAVKGHE